MTTTVSVTYDQVLEDLIRTLEAQSITVKYDRGNFRGGLVRYHDCTCFYLNRRATVEEKIRTIISELKQMSLSGIILDETISDWINEYDDGESAWKSKKVKSKKLEV